MERFVVGGAGIGLGQGGKVVAGGVAAQAGGGLVPAAQRMSAARKALADRFAERPQEIVRDSIPPDREWARRDSA